MGGHFCHDGNYTGDGKTPEANEMNKEVYQGMVDEQSQVYEYYNGKSHAWHGGFGFGTTLTDLWGKPYSGMSFFNLFHCSSMRYIEKNLGAMMAISTKSGLASIGCTHTGAMLGNQVFESELEKGHSWGDAFMSWFNQYG